MLVAVIGAGPAGLLLGASLVRRGHEVVAVDRDPGPPAEGYWPRRGVMQFHHAHGFRPQVGMVLEREWPEAHAAWLAAGAEPKTFQMPGGATVPGGYRSRRDTFERALRASAPAVAGFTLRQGHVDRVLTDGGRVRGLVVDGAELAADLVIDASGRSGHAADDVREPVAVGGLCGMAYVDRQYRLHEGAEPGPMTNQIAWQADLDGYQCIVFLHERGFFSVLLVRPTVDAALKDLRHPAAFEAACRAVPGPRGVDRSRAGPPGHRRPARRPAAQRLPRAGTSRRLRSAARLRRRRRLRRHHDADVRPRADDDVRADPAAAGPAGRRRRT